MTSLSYRESCKLGKITFQMILIEKLKVNPSGTSLAGIDKILEMTLASPGGR